MKRHFISISPLHTFTTPLLRQKTFLLLIIIIIHHCVYCTRILKNYIFLFSFHHYLNNVAIMRKRYFFSFCYYLHYVMIKRKNFFILLLRSLRYDQEISFFILLLRSLHHDQEKKCFFHLVTKSTIPWSREKKFQHSFRYVMVTGEGNLIFIAPLLWWRYDHEKIFFFHLTTTFTTQISSYIIFHLSTTLSTKKSPNDILPRKIRLT